MWKSAPVQLLLSEPPPNFIEHRVCNSAPSHPSGHYADDVSTRADHSSIPAEALAKKARLQSVLRVMEEDSPSREPACLRDLRILMGEPSTPDLDAVSKAVLTGNHVEEACELLRTLRRERGD